MTKAEERAFEVFPEDIQLFVESQEEPGKWLPVDENAQLRYGYKRGYEQAEKDIIALVKQYIEKGERCMEQEGESQIYAFWDGFLNCAENILRELKEK